MLAQRLQENKPNPMTPERFARLTHALKNRQPDLTVVTDEVHKDRNLSAIIRNCEAVGIHEMHCVTKTGRFRPFRGTTKGAYRWVKLNVYQSIEVPLQHLKEKGFQLVAAHFCNEAVNFRDVDYTRPTAIVMGNERDGLSNAADSLIDQTIVIPMSGMVESFNVSVASGIILSEAQRQRELAGLYGTNPLPVDEYEKTFFEWAHPRLTAFCRDNRIPYPPVAEDGEVVDAVGWYKEVRTTLNKGKIKT